MNKNMKGSVKLSCSGAERERLPKITSTIKSILEPRKFISSKMPYAEKRYDLKEHNPPSNELGFLGGLGKRTGMLRSKAHVQRPTMNQILFHMRTTNRILRSFTEDPILAHSYTRRQLEMEKSPKPIRKTLKKGLNETISRIQIADNVIKVKKGLKLNSTTSETDDKQAQEVRIELPGGKGEEKKKSRGFTLGTMKKISIVSAMKAPEPPKKEEEQPSFRKWALAEREKRHQALQQVSYQQIKQEREANEIFPKVKKAPKLFVGDRKRKEQPPQLPGAEHLGGYLYGGFTEVAGPDITMDNQTKFNVPFSMFTRAAVESKVRAMCRKRIQSARLDYMNIPQIPSDSENSDDIFEDIKGLSLVRTPYFLVPTITHTKVKRMERLKSKHLRGNRLKRINMLLFDRKLSAEKYRQMYAMEEVEFVQTTGEKVEEDEDLQTECATLLPEIVQKRTQKDFDSQYRQRYHDYVHDKFLEKLQQYNDKLNQKFDEFRDTGATPGIKTDVERKSFRDYSMESMSTNVPCPTPDIQKDPAFKRVKQKIRKNQKFSRSECQTGGFYFDPYLLEKVHNPEKGMKIMKNYTSLMRSQSSNIRKRLQVNAPTFDEEKCGTRETGSFYHRLVTEWDSYYINEIRHRATVQKFCVKTDIIKIRETVRKKFFLFFMQEDLMNLFAKQEIENEMINKTTKFIKACEPQFKQLQDESFRKAREKLDLVNVVSATTVELRAKSAMLKDELDLLMQKLMTNERKWEAIMMMQNYYYLMMLPLWRLDNDWIHRNKSGQLDFLKKSVIYCKKIHIRSKSVSEISLHAIKDFFETSIEPKKLDQMRKIRPDVDLLRASLKGIKSNVLGILNKHNEIMLKSTEILFQQQQLEKAIPVIISEYQKNMSHIDKKVNFVEKRIEFLIKEVEQTSHMPLMKCVKNIFMRKIDAISRHLCKTLFAETFRIDESIRKYSLIENFCMISERALNLLSQLDTLPTEILHSAERETRLHRRDKMRQGKLAMSEQNLFKMLEQQLRNHFTNPSKPKKSRKSKMKILSKFAMATPKPRVGK